MPHRNALAARRPRLLAALAAAGAFVVGGVALPPLAATAQEAAVHGGMGMEGHARMHAMMAAHLEKMLASVDATPDQKSRIESILGGAMRGMAGAHHQMHDRLADLHRLLSAPTVDRGALERLRASEIADLDTQSRALVGAFADAAEVLTPQQRAKLAAMTRDHATE